MVSMRILLTQVNYDLPPCHLITITLIKEQIIHIIPQPVHQGRAQKPIHVQRSEAPDKINRRGSLMSSFALIQYQLIRPTDYTT